MGVFTFRVLFLIIHLNYSNLARFANKNVLKFPFSSSIQTILCNATHVYSFTWGLKVEETEIIPSGNGGRLRVPKDIRMHQNLTIPQYYDQSPLHLYSQT